MSLLTELPDNFEPLVVLGEVDGYLHIYTNQDNEVVKALLDMGLQSVESESYDEIATHLH